MNAEELKKEFAKHLQVSELDTRDGYAVEWTVAAMKQTNPTKYRYNEPAELSIYNAMREVEKMPADTRLTEAVILLGKAKELVSAFINEKINEAGESF